MRVGRWAGGTFLGGGGLGVVGRRLRGIRPEVTVYGWQHFKIQELTNLSNLYCLTSFNFIICLISVRVVYFLCEHVARNIMAIHCNGQLNQFMVLCHSFDNTEGEPQEVRESGTYT